MTRGNLRGLPRSSSHTAVHTICAGFLLVDTSAIIFGFHFFKGERKHHSLLTLEPFCTEHSPENLTVRRSDSSHADAEDRKSTSGYIFKFAGGTVCHKSSNQKLVITSTTEAEYVGLTYAAKEAAWLCRLLHQLGYFGNDTHPIRLYGDNQPSINIVHAEGHHERTKYIDIYYHYIRERVKDGHIDLQHLRTGEMIADGLTKPLAPIVHGLMMGRFS